MRTHSHLRRDVIGAFLVMAAFTACSSEDAESGRTADEARQGSGGSKSRDAGNGTCDPLKRGTDCPQQFTCETGGGGYDGVGVCRRTEGCGPDGQGGACPAGSRCAGDDSNVCVSLPCPHPHIAVVCPQGSVCYRATPAPSDTWGQCVVADHRPCRRELDCPTEAGFRCDIGLGECVAADGGP